MQIVPEELALIHNMRKMVKNDWVSACDVQCTAKRNGLGFQVFVISSHLPPLFVLRSHPMVLPTLCLGVASVSAQVLLSETMWYWG